MKKEDQKEGVMNQMYLGHRIHFNWPLIIIMAWMSMLVLGALNKTSKYGCISVSEILSGED